MQTIPIPHVDPLPLPGPVWLLTALLLVVFTLHLAAMNSALGGGIWALWNYLRGRHSAHPYSRRLANELAAMLPVFLAFTVTLGVAALLFVQVLFGNFLYASSILMGILWLAVIPLVMAGLLRILLLLLYGRTRGRESPDACWRFRYACCWASHSSSSTT